MGDASPAGCASCGALLLSAVDLDDKHLLNKGWTRQHAPRSDEAAVHDAPPKADADAEAAAGMPALDEAAAAELAMLAAMGLPVAFGGARAKGGARRGRAPHAVQLAGRAPPCGTHVRFSDGDAEDGDAAASSAPPCAPPPAAASGKPSGVPAKYWAQRYRLFSKFDAGAAVDGDMWFSVTPEAVARHQAARAAAAGARLVLDAFAGAGGNTVAFAAAGAHALGVDVDRARLLAARRNAALYGVASRCDWVCADWTQLSAAMARHRPLAPDLLFLSPPWGGPDYLNAPSYDLGAPMAGGADAAALLARAGALAPRVMFFLPRNVAPADVAALAAAAAPGARAELEDVHLNGAKKACTLYVGAPLARGALGCALCGVFALADAGALRAHCLTPEHVQAAGGLDVAFGCALCGIPAMSDAPQLEAHLRGKRHLAALLARTAAAEAAQPVEQA